MNSASNRFSVKKSGSPSHHSDKTNLIGDTHDDEVVVVSGSAGDQQQHYGAVFQNGKKRKKSRGGKKNMCFSKQNPKIFLSSSS